MTSTDPLDPLNSEGSTADLDMGDSPTPGARKCSASPVDGSERRAGASESDNETGRRPRVGREADAPKRWQANTPPVAEFAEVVATRVVELLEQRDHRRRTGLVTAEVVAERLGVGKSWVYANKKRLGAISLGSGPKARLRFDLETASRAMQADRRSPRGESRRRGRQRRAADLPPGVELIEGRRSAAES